MSGGSGQKDFQSETILRDIRVLAIDQTIQEPKDQQSAEREPQWLATLPAGARVVYEYW